MPPAEAWPITTVFVAAVTAALVALVVVRVDRWLAHRRTLAAMRSLGMQVEQYGAGLISVSVRSQPPSKFLEALEARLAADLAKSASPERPEGAS